MRDFFRFKINVSGCMLRKNKISMVTILPDSNSRYILSLKAFRKLYRASFTKKLFLKPKFRE